MSGYDAFAEAKSQAHRKNGAENCYMTSIAFSESDARQYAQSWLKASLKEPSQAHNSQFNSLLHALGKLCVAETVKNNEGEQDLDERLYMAYDIVSSTQTALYRYEDRADDPESDDEKNARTLRDQDNRLHRVWFRRDPQAAFEGGLKSSASVDINRDDLIYQAAEYLKRPWLRDPFLDWIFVDSLIFCDVCACGESLKRDYPLGGIGWLGVNSARHMNAYYEFGGNWYEMQMEHFRWRLRKIGWFLGVPLIAIFALSLNGRSAAALISIKLYFSVLAAYLGSRIVRWGYRKATKWKPLEASYIELWSRMSAVYRMTKGPIINPSILKDELLETKKAGAVWEMPLYSLIDRIISVDPNVWAVDYEPLSSGWRSSKTI